MLDGTVESRRFQSGELELVVQVDKGEADLPREGGRRGPRLNGDAVTLTIPPQRRAHRRAKPPAHRRRGGRAGVGVGGSLTVCKGRRMVCGSA